MAQWLLWLDYGLVSRRVVVRNPAWAIHFSALQSAQADCGAHRASCLVGTGNSCPGGKTAVAWSWLLIVISCRGEEWVEIYHILPHGQFMFCLTNCCCYALVFFAQPDMSCCNECTVGCDCVCVCREALCETAQCICASGNSTCYLLPVRALCIASCYLLNSCCWFQGYLTVGRYLLDLLFMKNFSCIICLNIVI